MSWNDAAWSHTAEKRRREREAEGREREAEGREREREGEGREREGKKLAFDSGIITLFDLFVPLNKALAPECECVSSRPSLSGNLEL